MAEPAKPGGLGALLHPVVLGALVVLVLNDTIGKTAWPGVVTGKLSDVAGLVVAPIAVACVLTLMGLAGNRAITVSVTAIGTWFVGMKVFAPIAAATERLAEVVVPHAQVVVDPTDLVALPALVVAAWAWRHRRPARAAAVPALVFAAVWSVATSAVPWPEVTNVIVRDDGSFLVADRQGDREVSADGRLDPERLDYDEERFAGDQQNTEVCLADDSCVRVAGQDVVVEAADGTITTVVDIPDSRLSAVNTGDGATDLGAQDVAANDDGVVVVAHGSHGVSIRSADGTWVRHGTDYTGSTLGPGGPMLIGVLVALAGFLVPRASSRGRGRGVAVWLLAAVTVVGALPVTGFMQFFGMNGLFAVAAAALSVVVVSVVTRMVAGPPRHRSINAALVALGIAAAGLTAAWVQGWIEHWPVVLVATLVMAVGTVAWAWMLPATAPPAGPARPTVPPPPPG